MNKELTRNIENGVVEAGSVVESVEVHEKNFTGVLLDVHSWVCVVRSLDTDGERNTRGSVVPEVEVTVEELRDINKIFKSLNFLNIFSVYFLIQNYTKCKRKATHTITHRLSK